MKPDIRVYLCSDEGEKFFGEGPYRLLSAIHSEGSLRKAAMQMNMAYSKAFFLLKRAEEMLGYPLTEKMTGGKGGGGSCLTPEAKELLKKYEQYRKECHEANLRIYRSVFSESE